MSPSEKDIIKRILSRVKDTREVIDLGAQIKGRLIPLTLDGELSERDFYRISSLLSSQSRSPLWERYFIKKHKCEKVGAQSNSGDFEKNGIFYEYKSSGYNRDNVMHIVQIRLWQKCDYVIQAISDETIHTFILKHKEMQEETKLCKAAGAHGTKTSNVDNKNVELRITIDKESSNWQRWCDKYAGQKI